MPHARHPKAYAAIHGHFYQPPRENPWRDEVPRQDSAAPHHDWNERILAECYRPNTASRVLDSFGRIQTIVNNFEYMNFNVGPTLMSWIERHHMDVYQRILDADRRSVVSRSGHGNAIAQVFHHMILPLADARDRKTQVLWGLREFSQRFGRAAEGIWLAETAIHAGTVETLIDCGVQYIVLAPGQANRVRPLGGGEWHDVGGAKIDPKMPYRLFGTPAKDGSPRGLSVFFYDGPISRAIAFENLLRSADVLAEKLAVAVEPGRQDPQLVSIGVDGETFGHHFAFGDMCLAAFFKDKAKPRGFHLTNYGEYLEKYPPTHEVQLEAGPEGEGTAWSCAHGVGRWVRDCGCNTGGGEGWNQTWRTPLRQAFDWLRDEVRPVFAERGGEIFHCPWQARDDYVDVVALHGGSEVLDKFLKQQLKDAGRERQTEALELLEAQHRLMAMYTSCAWFFSDITGIETIQNLRYAARGIELMQPYVTEDLEEGFLLRLESARSNNGSDTGATLYRRIVRPEICVPEHAVVVRAIFRLLEASTGRPSINGLGIRESQRQVITIGKYHGIHGHVWLQDKWTRSEKWFSFLAIEFSSRDLRCFVRPANEKVHQETIHKLSEFPDDLGKDGLLTTLAALYGRESYGLEVLSAKQRRLIAERLAAERVAGLKHHFRVIFEENRHLLEDYADLGLQLPGELRAPCEFTLQSDLMRYARALRPPFAGESAKQLCAVMEDANRFRIRLDLKDVTRILEKHLGHELGMLKSDRAITHFEALEELLNLIEKMHMPVERACAEEIMFEILQADVFPVLRQADDESSRTLYVEKAMALARRLNFATDHWEKALASH